MKATSIKETRQEFKQKGIFHTPDALAKRLLSYVDNNPQTVYDPTCGAGALLKVFSDDVEKYGQEIEPDYLARIDLPNFHGYCGDTLTDDGFKDLQFDCIVANPPFSIKWTPPDDPKSDARFADAPAVPPPSKADWAFMLHILHHLKPHGVAVVLCFPGILYRGQREGKIRQWFVEQNVIDRVVNIPGNTFEDTSIATVIVVIRKNRQTTDIIFEDDDKSQVATLEEVQENDYVLSPSTYIPVEYEREEYDIDEINRQVVDTTLNALRNTFEMLKSLQETFPADNLYIDRLLDGVKQIVAEFERRNAA